MTRPSSTVPRSQGRYPVSKPYYTPRSSLLSAICADFRDSLGPLLSLKRDTKLDKAPFAQTSEASLHPESPFPAHTQSGPRSLKGYIICQAVKRRQAIQGKGIPAES